MILRKILVVCVLVLGLFGNAIADLNSGLVAYYPFDGHSNDVSGNGTHGVEHGSVTYNKGHINSAVELINNSYVTSDSPINKDTSFTVSAWVNPFSINIADVNIIVMERDSNFNDSCGINSAGNYGVEIYTGRFAFETSTIENNVCTLNRIFASTNININQYYFITATYDKTSSAMKLYIDGVLENELTVGSSLRTNPNAILNIGRNGAPQFWNGEIDDLRVYNRILTESEIQRLYTISGSNSTSSCASPKAVTVSENLDIQIPSLNYTSLLGTQNLWANLKYYGKGSNGEILWKLKDFGTNQ